MSFKGLASKVNELRIICCSSSLSSKGARDFVLKNHAAIRESNPTLSFMVRQREGIEPSIIGQYAGGLERKISINGLNSEQVGDKLKELLK